VRAYSTLCENYIKGKNKDLSLEWIANRMCEMKYLHEYCNIDDYMDDAYDIYKDEYKDFEHSKELCDFFGIELEKFNK